MYGKIYESTFTGSMFGAGSPIFAVWSYVIAHTTPDSMVELNPALLAATLGENQGKIQEVIDSLCSPDERSRTKKFEGRRLIKKSEFMYFVPTYSHYRGLRNDEERRQYFAQKKREQRERDRERQTESQIKSKMSNDVHPSNNASASAFSSEEWISTLSKDSTYQGIDVETEFGKMCRWCQVNHKEPTKRRFINWLNRADRPIRIKAKDHGPFLPKDKPVHPLTLPPETTDDERKKAKEELAKEVEKLKEKFRMPT